MDCKKLGSIRVKGNNEQELEYARDHCNLNCKTAINSLLWEFLPPFITLEKADHIACEILDLIDATWLDDDVEEKEQ